MHKIFELKDTSSHYRCLYANLFSSTFGQVETCNPLLIFCSSFVN